MDGRGHSAAAAGAIWCGLANVSIRCFIHCITLPLTTRTIILGEMTLELFSLLDCYLLTAASVCV